MQRVVYIEDYNDDAIYDISILSIEETQARRALYNIFAFYL
ncbi:hypothetical protein M2451_001433 [Dysgonomonas sp. PFB1-18]|nr:hypothetical protein [Dysgonomonas sp. PF1-14]MDH6338437.1 hypothetical protein [Dysgonomonas sp. PF1-16]MDH6380116.1 hypothetical protein [Dysgonomonas sp. PFB1-18]MDH6397265.1 hypothetical protein [Dysgonomonas sp. PF1-23]